MSEAKSFDYWDFFLVECQRANAPLYVEIVRGIGADDDLKELASHLTPGQPMANVILAAVHFLLLRGAQHPLRQCYANLNGGERRNGEDAFPLFKDFVNAHRDEVAALIARGITNTNEVARCSALHPAFRTVAKEAGEPLALIEIGPSAGLNMVWDKYRVRYARAGQTLHAGPGDAALTIDCVLRGEQVPPMGPSPRVARRMGLELNPVDLSDPYWRDWLRALVWPDQVERFTRLETAIDIAAEEKQDIRPGSALDLLSGAIAGIPQDLPVCVYHTHVVYQFTEEMRATLNDILVAASLRRPVWRLSIEGSVHTPGTAEMKLARYHDGTRALRQLGLCHPHGAWLEWQDA
ncbi:MAG TPA: DUF2332 domain-containing protein [Rhizomicrobium sp.]|nr:DUF2332 domain-containing protein [Rhizomicrobium sp.]